MNLIQKRSTDAEATAIGGVKNVLIVGVGGQGVIMVSKVLASICQIEGYNVKQSEVHGMAKRGGSVFSHVRFGAEVWSPTIPKGKADVLVALEWAEGLRWLNYLKKETGTLIADTQHIVPPFACLDRTRGGQSGYSTQVPSEILENLHDGYALDATKIATEIGNYRVSNIVLLGTLSALLDFPVDVWRTIISDMVPPKTIELNLKAFEAGRLWVEESRKPGKVPEQAPAVIPQAKIRPKYEDFELVLTLEWCKGCDICVKVCPERCLVLDAEQKVELAKPDSCTGCRICEWLCPDFAIDVKKIPPEIASA